MAQRYAGLREEVSGPGAELDGNPGPHTPAASTEQPQQYVRGWLPLTNRVLPVDHVHHLYGWFTRYPILVNRSSAW
jgi:hypothetical protein